MFSVKPSPLLRKDPAPLEVEVCKAKEEGTSAGTLHINQSELAEVKLLFLAQ